MKVTIEFDTDNHEDVQMLDQLFISKQLFTGNPTVPDTLAAIAPEPPVETAPMADELAVGITPQTAAETSPLDIPPSPPVPEAPHPAPMAPPAPAGFDDVDDAPVIPDAPVNEAPLEHDNQGLPWDGRIHASSKLMTTKGNWKRRRGVEDKVYNQVVAELTTTRDTEADQQHAAELAEETLAEVPDAATAGFGGNGSTGEMTWPDLVQRVMTAKVQELVSQEQLDSTCADLGVTGGFNNLVGRPDLYERFVMELNL